jgi:hypothetical protein
VDPIPDPLLLRISGSADNRTRDLWVSSQEICPLGHRVGHCMAVMVRKYQATAANDPPADIRAIINALMNKMQTLKFISQCAGSFYGKGPLPHAQTPERETNGGWLSAALPATGHGGPWFTRRRESHIFVAVDSHIALRADRAFYPPPPGRLLILLLC